MGVWAETSIPFPTFHFQLVPLIPYSTIAETILVRTLIFSIFTHVENELFKTNNNVATTNLTTTFGTVCSFSAASC